MYDNIAFAKMWWITLMYNLKDFYNSLKEDFQCTFFLGIFAIIPLIMYIIYGVIVFIILSIGKYVLHRKTRIIPIINEHQITHCINLSYNLN